MSRPIGVSILAVGGYLGAVWCAVTGILVAVSISTHTVQTLANAIPWGQANFNLSSFTVLMRFSLAAILLLCAVLQYVLSRGLWQLKNWARQWLIGLSVFGLVLGGDSVAESAL
jgi:hypothetical protein